MAGHNEWSNGNRLKGALDAKRGKLFSKLAKEITLAAKTRDGSSRRPESVPALGTVLSSFRHLISTAGDQLCAIGDSDFAKRAGLEPHAMSVTCLLDRAEPLLDEPSVTQFLRVSDALEDNDDARAWSATAEISEALLVKIGD